MTTATASPLRYTPSTYATPPQSDAFPDDAIGLSDAEWDYAADAEGAASAERLPAISKLAGSTNPTRPNDDAGISLDDLLAKPRPPKLYLAAPFVSAKGVTFLYGRYGLGKSPLTWELACAVALGRPFLGKWPTTQGRVLYIELDTDESLVAPRLSKLLKPYPTGDFLRFIFQPSCDVIKGVGTERFKRAQAPFCPDLVIVNTLRKTNNLEFNDGATPNRVYGAFKTLFPQAALVFVHHDRKTGPDDGSRNQDEAFAGTQAWINDAQVGLHLRSLNHDKRLLSLDHTKNQTEPFGDKHTLKLDADGTQISYLTDEKTTRVKAAYAQTDTSLPYKERVKAASQALTETYGDGYSPRSVERTLGSTKAPQPAPPDLAPKGAKVDGAE